MKLSYEHYYCDNLTGEIASHPYELTSSNYCEIWYFATGDFRCKIIHKLGHGYECDSIEWPDFRSAIQYVQALYMYALA